MRAFLILMALSGVPLATKFRRSPTLALTKGPRWRGQLAPRVSAKRLFDLAVAVVGLILTAPFFAVIAAGVKLSSPGPVIFRQTRVGAGGHEFRMLKFRSMRVANAADFNQSGGGDPRLTAIGRFIRRFSLDELPQLWNVLRGDMAIVGPRPEQPYFVNYYRDLLPGYADRHRVKAGLTGWSQVNGLRGGDSSLEDRIRLDNYYIENWSLWWDFVITLRTFSALGQGS